MNAQSLKHPRTQWEIEAAMWRAIENSRKSPARFGVAAAFSATGSVMLGVFHDRHAIPAFSFHRNGQDITAQVLAVLRGKK